MSTHRDACILVALFNERFLSKCSARGARARRPHPGSLPFKSSVTAAIVSAQATYYIALAEYAIAEATTAVAIKGAQQIAAQRQEGRRSQLPRLEDPQWIIPQGALRTL